MNKFVLDANIYIKIFKNETNSKQAIELVNNLIKTQAEIIEPSIAIRENALFITADKKHYEKTKHLGNIKLYL
jgi:predicted nucleic acid-binding protein